jgi:hypothetical protein
MGQTAPEMAGILAPVFMGHSPLESLVTALIPTMMNYLGSLVALA